MIPIVDAHHHIWRQADLAWLKGPMQPRIFGPYEPIRRDYPIEEYQADLQGTGVVRSVYVQTNWPKGGEIDEVAWVQAEASRSGWPHAIVSYLDLLADDARPTLQRQLTASPLLRGVRMQLHWHQNELYRFQPRPDLMNEPAFRRNLALLAERDLVFDLQVFTSQMADAAKLAAAFPTLPMVLMHAGMPEDASPSGHAAWQAGMCDLAGQPNVHVKLSGLGTFIHRVDPAQIQEIALETVAIFGADRCVFGSNFPIEKLWTDYASLIAAHRTALSSLPSAEQRTILHDNAMRLYRIG